RAAMGGPAGVPDPQRRRRKGPPPQHCSQLRNPACRLAMFDPPHPLAGPVDIERDPNRDVTPVLKAPKTLYEDRRRFSFTDEPDDPAHGIPPGTKSNRSVFSHQDATAS